jgi:hypothetical protein
MAIVHNSVTVGTEPTIIATIPAGNPTTVVLVSNTDAQTIWLGDETLSSTGATKGIRMASAANLEVSLNAGDVLYSISAAGTAANAVTVLYSKVIG